MKRALPFFLLAAVLLVAIVASKSGPRTYDRRLRAERQGDEPFDAEAFYRLLPGLLGAPVEPVGVSPYERLADSTLVGTAYVFVTGAFEPGQQDADRLLAYMRRGNTVVVAAQALGGPLFVALGDTATAEKRTPGLATNWTPDDFSDIVAEATEALSVGLPADTLLAGGRRYAFPISLDNAFLLGLDSARTVAVATREEGPPVAVAVAVGRGRAVVLAAPLALTNAALAGEGDAPAFAAAILRYVPPVRRVLWDDTFKPLRQTGGAGTGLLAVAWRSAPLRGALVALAVGTLLAVAFLGRRRQRPIPPRAPPPNAQREFARTVGRLFFVRDDRAWLARRKARVFEDALRTRLGLADADLSDDTARRAAARTGAAEDEALALFARLRDLDASFSPDGDALLALDRDLDAFLARRDGAEAPGRAPRPTAEAR